MPRLTVEVVIVSPDGSCSPGAKPDNHLDRELLFRHAVDGNVQWFAEAHGATRYIPETLTRSVGIALSVHLTPSSAAHFRPTPDAVAWLAQLPDEMHDEQKLFLREHGLAA